MDETRCPFPVFEFADGVPVAVQHEYARKAIVKSRLMKSAHEPPLTCEDPTSWFARSAAAMAEQHFDRMVADFLKAQHVQHTPNDAVPGHSRGTTLADLDEDDD